MKQNKQMNFRRTYSILAFFIFQAVILTGQEALDFQKPSAPILALADYERAPQVLMDANKEFMILTYRNTYKTLDDLNQEEMRLAGLRVNPITNIGSTITYVNNLKIRKVKNYKDEPQQVSGLPPNPKITYITWSPDQTHFAFTNTTALGVELWVCNISKAQAMRLTDATLNANTGNPITWHADSKRILVRKIPANRIALLDPKKDLPKGPSISKTEGKVSQNRTFQDLLKNTLDEQNFKTLLNCELVNVQLSGAQEIFKTQDLFLVQSISPDGKYVYTVTCKTPFSYIVPVSRFPQTTIVYDIQGNLIQVVNEVPLNEIMPKGFESVRKGKRSMQWRDDKPASLTYVEALDEGDQSKAAEYRDALYSWDAPFTSPPTLLMKTINRFGSVTWGTDQVAIATDSWYDTRNVKTYLFQPGKPEVPPKILFDRNYQDIYSDPGTFETSRNAFGKYVLHIDNNQLYLIGDGFTAEGQFPFIDALHIEDGKKSRLYRSTLKNQKEDIYEILDVKNKKALVMIQASDQFPNYYIRNYGDADKVQQITFHKNPFESIKGIHKEVIKYKRKDGVDCSGTLYLPVGYDKVKKEKLPLLIWAYPEEFKDKSSAGQNNKNPNEFTFPNYGSFVYWVTKGYVVLDDASFPIIGEGTKEPNDNFIEQLVANGRAAIDAVDQLGYIDRTKVAVGGHSYGAFMTANLLTHSDDFTCGIARSGAYNRTLTPFGFQSEQRNYWDVPQVYNEMSPFYTAHKMKKPILLIHGEADNNPGTFTLQTERYFQAIKGLGGNARMVILPKESHGYVAKENILHLLYEQEIFLDKYLKGK